LHFDLKLVMGRHKCCCTLSIAIDNRCEQLGITDKATARKWMASVVRMMQLVDTRAAHASTQPPPPLPLTPEELGAKKAKDAKQALAEANRMRAAEK